MRELILGGWHTHVCPKHGKFQASGAHIQPKCPRCAGEALTARIFGEKTAVVSPAVNAIDGVPDHWFAL